MNAKKLACLLLIGAMLTSLTACGSTAEVDTAPTVSADAETETETEKRWLDDLPETMDLEGASIRFLLEDGPNDNLTERSLVADEEAEDVVSAAVYNRTLASSERFNTEIEVIETVVMPAIGDMVRSAVTSGTDAYDVVGVYQYYNGNLAPDGMLMDLSAMPHNDFSREYWGGKYMDSMACKNIRFWATGDLALRYTGGVYCTFVNADMALDVLPDVDFYDTVNEGKWTMDLYNELTETAYADLNGNGEKDEDDRFGSCMSMEDPIDGMAIAAMVRWSETDENGLPVITIDNERTYAFYEKMYRLVCENPGFYKAKNDDNKTVMTMFAEGGVLMTVNKLFQSEIYLRDMSENFSIIPAPKLDEAQAHYNTILHDSCTLFGVPKTNVKVDATSAVLEALAAESFRQVTPTYYDVALKAKYTRDAESARMIDLIRENITSDFVFQYSNKINDIAHIFRSRLDTNKSELASYVAQVSKTWQKKLDQLLTSLEENALS